MSFTPLPNVSTPEGSFVLRGCCWKILEAALGKSKPELTQLKSNYVLRLFALVVDFHMAPLRDAVGRGRPPLPPPSLGLLFVLGTQDSLFRNLPIYEFHFLTFISNDGPPAANAITEWVRHSVARSLLAPA